MDIIDRTTHPSAHWPGISLFFGMNYDEEQDVYPQLYEMKRSTMAHEEMVENAAFGLAPEQGEGAPVLMDKTSELHKFRTQHVAYGLAFAVTREERDDNLYPVLASRRVPSLVFSMRQTKEVVAHTPYNLAFDATAGLRVDGASLVSATHTQPGGNQSNIIATPADISELSLEQIATQIRNIKNQRGLKMNATPRKLIISPEQSFDASRILDSVLQANTNTNNVNVLRAKNIIPTIVVTPYLDDKDAFFILTSVMDGMCFYDRTDLEIKEDYDFETEARKVKAYMRFSVVSVDWRGIFGSPGA